MENFYVLMIVNHVTKEYNTRVEPERGDNFGSIHSLQSYITTMTRQVTKMDLGVVKDHWMKPMWERITTHSNYCEQMVVAVIKADDVKAARQIWRSQHRDAFVALYSGMGYRSFYADYQAQAALSAKALADLATSGFETTFPETANL